MERHSIERIYEDNAKLVYKYLFCLCQSVDIAEDLTQETFYQATKTIKNFRGECKVSVWLCQIAKRLWYKEIDKRKQRNIPLEEMEEKVDSTVNVDNECLAQIEKVELFKMLHEFDESIREVMYLRLSGELSFSQIGNIMGRTETWARVTFYRGKQKLMEGRKKWDKK